MPSLAIITAVLSTNMAIFHVQPPTNPPPPPPSFPLLPPLRTFTQYQYSTNITQNKRISSPQGRDGPPLVFCLIFIISHKDLKTSGETAFCPTAVTTPTSPPSSPPYFSCTHSVGVHMSVCVCVCVCMPGCPLLFRSNPSPAVQLPGRVLPCPGKFT